MNSWNQITIGELIDSDEASLQTGPFGTQFKASEYVESGIPMVNVKNIGYGDVRTDSLDFLDEKTAHRLRVHQLKAGDLVFGRKGSADRHALIDPATDGWVQGSDCMRLRLASKRLKPRFLSYYFCTSGHKYWMEAVCAFGSTMSTLNQGIVRRITLQIPRVEVQNKVAAVLSAYDELIENNRRRIALLEKLAEEIYREWFVRLRFPGHEKVKLAKGIPNGWRVAELNELATVNPSSISRRDNLETIRYVDISSVSTNRIEEITDYTPHEAPGRARRRVKHGDVIWSSVRPSNRAYCLIYDPPENLIVSTGFAVIRPNAETPFTFLFFAVTSNPFVDQMTTVAKGAAYPATSFDDFEKAKLLVPSDDLLKSFHEKIEPLFRQKHLLQQQCERLKQTRDKLLPRLISGKLPVENLAIQFPPGMAEELQCKQ